MALLLSQGVPYVIPLNLGFILFLFMFHTSPLKHYMQSSSLSQAGGSRL